jgi:hypothetical protein
MVHAVEEAMKNVKLSMEAWIDHEINPSSRTKGNWASGNGFQNGQISEEIAGLPTLPQDHVYKPSAGPYKDAFI